MSGRDLLDTNPVIAIFAEDPGILFRIAEAEEVFVPSIVLGELYFGAYKSARVTENVARVAEFAAGNRIVECDASTARNFGQIKDDLRRKGRMIPENDIWIAALARQHDLTLVSRDAHFHEVEGLVVASW
jgi:tRNA(fMet)-specific endonuclease VapC